MKDASMGIHQMRNRLVLVGALVFVVLPPAIALAGTQFNYAQGRNGAGGIFGTAGYGPRDYNQVWHQAGRTWEVYYVQPSGFVYGYRRDTENPTKQHASNSYARSVCANVNDNSYVLWTCQTTM
jgi:hypothetical protein